MVKVYKELRNLDYKCFVELNSPTDYFSKGFIKFSLSDGVVNNDEKKEIENDFLGKMLCPTVTVNDYTFTISNPRITHSDDEIKTTALDVVVEQNGKQVLTGVLEYQNRLGIITDVYEHMDTERNYTILKSEDNPELAEYFNNTNSDMVNMTFSQIIWKVYFIPRRHGVDLSGEHMTTRQVYTDVLRVVPTSFFIWNNKMKNCKKYGVLTSY